MRIPVSDAKAAQQRSSAVDLYTSPDDNRNEREAV